MAVTPKMVDFEIYKVTMENRTKRVELFQEIQRIFQHYYTKVPGVVVIHV